MKGRTLLFFAVLIVTSRGSNEYADNSQEQGLNILLAALTPNKNVLRRTLNDVDIYDHSRLERKALVKNKLLESQQQRKRDEIMQFLSEHYLTTNYFYDEMKRIIRTRTLKDPLRLMVEYLEKPENREIKYYVLRNFYQVRLQKLPIVDPYAHKLNNLVINVMKTPYSDGVH